MVKSHLVQEKQPFERIEVSRAEALEMFAENEFKATFLAPVLFVSFLYIILLLMLNIYMTSIHSYKKMDYMFRLKSLMSCPRTRPLQYTGVVL